MKQSVYRSKKREELIKKAARLYKEGMSTRQVAAIIGKSHTWVAKYVLPKLSPVKQLT
jgi:transposase